MDAIGPWVQVVVTLVLSGVMGLIAWSLKGLYRSSEERQRRTEEDVREIRRDYALKEDVIREGASTRAKIDVLMERMSDLNGKVEGTQALMQSITTQLRQDGRS